MATGHEDEHGLDSAHGDKVEFTKSAGLTSADATVLLAQYGLNELESKGTPSWLLYLEQLYQPMPIVLWIAIIVEGAIEDWADFSLLLVIQFANATLAWYEATKAGDAVAALKASLKPKATAKRDGTWITMDASLLVPGDLVLLGAGSSVPADCLINHGTLEVDQSALTGESMPVTMHEGDCARMGSTCARGEVEATVQYTGKNTFFGQTAALLNTQNEMGNLQRTLLTIMIILLVLVLTFVLVIFIYLLVENQKLKPTLSFCVVLIVACIPIAMEIVCTTTLAIGSRGMSEMGAIVARLSAIEDLAGMNILCSDKTGTLTLNKMVIQDETPTYMEGMDQATVLVYGALAAKWREPPRDALDTLVLTTVDLEECDKYEQIAYMPFDPIFKRTEGTVIGPDGLYFKTSKGAPHIILKLVNDPEMTEKVEAEVTKFGSRGIRCLAVCKTTPSATVPPSEPAEGEEEWHMVGLLTFLDPPRPDTKATIERAMEYGVDVKMITGDHKLIAKETMRQLGLKDDIRDASFLPELDMAGGAKVPKDLGKNHGQLVLEADGFAQVFPQHKFMIVETLRQCGFVVGMTGDGVNDAPALKRADVGIAVQGATDAARAAADIVLTEPGLSTIVDGMVIARCIFQRMSNFITYRISASLQLLVFFFISTFALKPTTFGYTAFFFEIPVLMLMLMTLLTDGVLISVSYDNVKPSQYPDRWNLKVQFLISSVHAVVACGSSLLLLWACLNSGLGDSSLFHHLGLPAPMPYGKLVTLMYMKVSITNFLTLFSARTHRHFFWDSMPGWVLIVGALLSLTVTTILACTWPTMTLDYVETQGLTRGGTYQLWPLWCWIYCAAWFMVQDLFKVGAFWLMHRYNVFNINNTASELFHDAGVSDDPKGHMVRTNMGQVEHRLLNMKVKDAVDALGAVEVEGSEGSAGSVDRQDSEVGRIAVEMSNKLQGVRSVSDRVRKNLMSGELTEGRVLLERRSIEMAVADVQQAAGSMPPELRKEVEPQVEKLSFTAKRLVEKTSYQG